jgi:hypothetical protein
MEKRLRTAEENDPRRPPAPRLAGPLHRRPPTIPVRLHPIAMQVRKVEPIYSYHPRIQSKATPVAWPKLLPGQRLRRSGL